MTFSAGQILTASALNSALQRIVAWGNRTSNSSNSTSTTPISVLRLDSVPITNLQSYVIKTSPIIRGSSVATDLIEIAFYVSTSGAATSASTHAAGLVGPVYSASGNQPTVGCEVLYNATTTGSLSVLMAFFRATGSGTCLLQASAAYPMNMWIESVGTSVSDTGVDL